MLALTASSTPMAVNLNASWMSPDTAVAARPLFTSSRKQACHDCRSRKKKCDGKLPSCSGCIKNKARCVYKPTRSDSRTNGGQSQALDHASAWSGSNDMQSTHFLQRSEPAATNPFDYTEWNLGTGQHLYMQNSALSSPGLHQEQYNAQQVQHQSPLTSQEQDPDTIGHVTQTATGTSSREVPNLGSDLMYSQNVSTSSYSTMDPFVHLSDAIEFRAEASDPTKPSDHPSFNGTRQSTSRSGVETAASSLEFSERASPSELHPSLRAAEIEIMPSAREVLELLDIFFSRYHFYLPCIHQKTFFDRVKRGRESVQSHPLIWAIMAVAASAHPDPRLQGLRSKWLARARSIFDKNLHSSTSITQSLQAAVWIIFQYYVDADLTEAWFFLGKTTRFANLMGVDRLDSCRTKHMITMVAQPRDSIEIEEQRKTIWTLLFLDRALSCMAALSLSIDERSFQVNFPLDDDLFQATTSCDNLSQSGVDTFTPDLASLVGPSVMQDVSSKPSMNHVYRASVLLGRIMTLHNQPRSARGDKNFSNEFAKLDNAMSLICFALSRGPQDDRRMTSAQLTHQIWLSTLVQTCNILLYHPLTSADTPDMLSPVKDAERDSGFERCVGAMRHNLDSIKQATSKNPESLVNPFLVTTYFLCCRFLCISWYEHGRQADHDEIEFLLMLLERLGERWAPLAKKFRKGIMRDLGKNAKQVQRMRVGTGCYLDIECA